MNNMNGWLAKPVVTPTSTFVSADFPDLLCLN